MGREGRVNSCWARASFHLDKPRDKGGTGRPPAPPPPHPTSAFTYGVTQCAHIRANEKGHVPAGTRGEDKAHLAPYVLQGKGRGEEPGFRPCALRASQMAPQASATILHVVVSAPGPPHREGSGGHPVWRQGGACLCGGSLTVLMAREYDVGVCPAQPCDQQRGRGS